MIIILSLIVLIYIYLGYPVLIYFMGSRYTNKDQKQEMDDYPFVSIIISAFNEEKYIKDKILNSLELEYPEDKLEVVVVSDGSTDQTLLLAESIESPNLHVINQVRAGKATALNKALAVAKGEYIVFTDANVFIDQGALKQLVCSMAIPNTGGVTGKVDLIALNSNEPLGESAYMKYERFLQKYESDSGCVVGVDGGMFIARKELVNGVPADIILDDFYIAMMIILNGSNIRYDEAATAIEYVPASVKQEFKRKIRIAAGGFQVLTRLPSLLSCSRSLFSIKLYSHKVLRWLSPHFLLVLYISSALQTANTTVYTLFILQNLMYLAAIIGFFSEKARNFIFIYIPYYFCSINMALFIGFFKAVTNTQNVTWTKVER